MRPEERKLKRGLQDVSGIFRAKNSAPDPVLLSNESDPKTVAVVNPGNFGDTLFLNSYLASLTAACGHSSAVISIGQAKKGDGRGSHRFSNSRRLAVPHVSILWDEFEMLCAKPLSLHRADQPGYPMVFVNTEYAHSSKVSKIAPILNKCILAVSPTVDSLLEAYRFIKGLHVYNQNLQYYLLFEGTTAGETGCILFERFAAILSRHLGINLVWLGHLNPLYSGSDDPELELEPLFHKDFSSTESPSGIALGQLIASLLNEYPTAAAS